MKTLVTLLCLSSSAFAQSLDVSELGLRLSKEAIAEVAKYAADKPQQKLVEETISLMSVSVKEEQVAAISIAFNIRDTSKPENAAGSTLYCEAELVPVPEDHDRISWTLRNAGCDV